MELLKAKDGKLIASEPIEICIPLGYYEEGLAIDTGITVEVFGILFIRPIKTGKCKLLNIPADIIIQLYDSRTESVTVNGKDIDCRVYSYLENAVVMSQFVVPSKQMAETFSLMVLNGNLPNVLPYSSLIDIWWSNLAINATDYKVPSNMLELIIATAHRDPSNIKRRYGQVYGKQTKPDEYGYHTDRLRNIVASLSTFAGIAFEDQGKMITSGINNSTDGIEEPVSPLEKIIYY